jgi:hypothetical protein
MPDPADYFDQHLQLKTEAERLLAEVINAEGVELTTSETIALGQAYAELALAAATAALAAGS